MVEIGKLNKLQVVKRVDFGVYLDGEHLDTILLPKRYMPENCAVGDWLDVFLYLDSDDMLIATTLKPRVMVDQCAYLKVVAVNPVGAFMDWGLPKDLLVPYNEQNKPMEVGNSYVVYVYLDSSTDRIAASTKLSNFLPEESAYFKPGQAVDLLICGRTNMGYKAVVNGTHLGLIFKNEVFQPLKMGRKIKGFIKDIRLDGKIDLCLQLAGQQARDELSQQILDHLEARGGTSTLTDKSSPDDIYKQFHVSKKRYKNTLGALYKQQLILIEKDRIKLL